MIKKYFNHKKFISIPLAFLISGFDVLRLAGQVKANILIDSIGDIFLKVVSSAITDPFIFGKAIGYIGKQLANRGYGWTIYTILVNYA